MKSINEMEKGKYYYLNIGKNEWTCQFDRIQGTNYYSVNGEVHLTGKSYYGGPNLCSVSSITDWREATPLEIAHLEACIKNRSWVEPVKELVYEIY